MFFLNFRFWSGAVRPCRGGRTSPPQNRKSAIQILCPFSRGKGVVNSGLLATHSSHTPTVATAEAVVRADVARAEEQVPRAERVALVERT